MLDCSSLSALAAVVRGQPWQATDTGRRMCQHPDRVRLLEQALQGALPALASEGVARVALPVAVNADSLAAVTASARTSMPVISWNRCPIPAGHTPALTPLLSCTWPLAMTAC